MHKRIFYSIFFIASISLLLFTIVTAVSITKSIEDTWERNLEAETNYLARLIALEGVGSVQELLGHDKRMTIIARDGRVIYDSSKDSFSLENHLQREEVQEALQYGQGDSVRYSTTLLEMSIYHAKVLPNGTILRVALLQESIFNYYKELIPAIVIFLFLLLVISYIGAKKFSASILAPILQIDLTNPQHIKSPYKELTPLLNTIVNQGKQIQEDANNKEAYRRDFTSNVSHELKTPLTSISGFAELMKAGDMDLADVVDFSSRIYEESQRLIQLVNDIIKLSELDGSLSHLEKEYIDLPALTHCVLEHLQGLSQKKHIDINFTSKPTYVYGNPKILDEIIYNLCDNAFKYNKDFGRVTIDIKATDTGSIFSIQDTGIGIPEEDLPYVFERFYRADKSHSKRIQGTGLGLSIVKHGLKYHDAHINIQSQLGEGTYIHIYFPKVPKDA